MIVRFESYELVSRDDAFMGTMFCIYQVYERTTIVILWTKNNFSSVNSNLDGWSGLSIVISLGNWRIIKGGIYISKEKWKKLCSLGPWMKCYVNIALLCF
jgi:hypothetical protein